MPDLKYITTDKDSGFPEYLDFATLRKLGIQHVADLSGKIWTDHNLHDPGITMLEALCYVLTDLDYRTKLSFKDLVAAPAGGGEDNFYTAAQILGNNPLTIADIRRMLIDIKGVRNAWLLPINETETEEAYSLSYDCDNGNLDNTRLSEGLSSIPLRGLYRVYIEPDDVYAAAYEKDACGNDVFPMDTVLSEIDTRLHAHRNLCEDFPDIVVLEKEPISLCLHIELAANYDPDEVLLNIYSSIQDFLSPAPVFYSLQQLLDKGRSMEEIFEGRPYDFTKGEPLQQNGFIDVQELESLEMMTELRASDLYRIIMKVPGVAGVTRLLMTSADEDGYAMTDAAGNPIKQEGEEWCLHLKKDHRPVLSPETSNVIFFRNKLPFNANAEVVNQRYKKGISDYNKFPKQREALDTVVPKGRQLDLAQYTSVQYEFPKVYMIGKNEVPGDATAARKAQALQLQAYLLFFDRLLADYFAQLSSIRKLFSLRPAPEGGEHTYFPADISGIPQLPSLLRYKKQLPQNTTGTSYNGMQLAYEPDASGTARKVYSSMYLRDEMIRRIISECTNNNVVRVIQQREDDGSWYFQLTDTADNVLLESTIFFSTKLAAEQAALDVVFLATLSGSYSRNNNRQEDIYSFDLVYNDAGDTEMLTALYETSDQYNERKERFLNHLLARFSEDFTDYALMMYNLSGKKNDPASNIADKAAFLSAYPETSANRALAFNYKEPATGFPVCGLEKRVAGLMGIRQSPSASLNNFDLVNVEKQTGFECAIPGQTTPLFVSESLHSKANISTVFGDFLKLGTAKANYRPYGCPGEGVFGFYIQSPLTANEWIAAKYSYEYSTEEERDAVMDWFVQFFDGDGQYRVYLQTQEGYYFLLPDDYGKALLKSKQGFETQEIAFSHGYDCLEILQDDSVWKIEPELAAGNYRIIIVRNNVQIAYHPEAYGTTEAAQKKMKELQEYFRKHYLVYQREASELYNWQMMSEGQAAWQGMVPFKDKAQLPVAFVQFVELASHVDNYLVVHRGGGRYDLQVIRKEAGEEDGTQGYTVMSVHISDFPTGDAARLARDKYVNLFSRLWLTVSGAVTSVSAAIYHFKDLECQAGLPEILLTTARAVPDGVAVAQATRSVIRHASDPQRVSIYTADECRYVVHVYDDAGQLLAESPETNDHATATKLLERILLKAGQDSLWVERGEAVSAYGFLWEDEKSGAALLQSIPVWDNREAAATAFLGWLLAATAADIQADQQPANGYGYFAFTKDGVPFAKQGKWYSTAEERDAVLLLLRQQVTALQESAGWSVSTLYHYYFKISDGEGLLLQEPHFYHSYDEVRTAFYNTVKFGKQRQYYLKTCLEDCTYSFKIISDKKEVLAIHPFEYTTTEARDAAIERTLRFLQDHGQAVTEVKLTGAWRYRWEWLSCCCWYPETALEGLDEKPELGEAEDALKYILEKLARTETNYDVVKEEGGYRVYLFDKGNKVAVHPHLYDSEYEGNEAIKRLVMWAGFTLSKFTSYSKDVDVRTDLYQSGGENAVIGYRLWDRDYRIARYCLQFDSAAEREQTVLALLQRYHRKLPGYTVLEKGASVVAGENGRYHYQLRRNDFVLWQSVAAYATADAAMAAFGTESWDLLQRSLSVEHYSAWTATTEDLYLNDDKGQPLAVTKITPGSYEAYTAAMQARRQFARRHGVYRKADGTFAFHIYNTKINAYEWESIHTYPDPDAATADLLEFMQLLLFRGNYCLDNETVGCYYSLNLGKVLLDIQQVTKRCDKEKDDVSEQDAWDRLQTFLDNLDPDNKNFFPYTDYAGGCRYAFRMVDDSVYRVAQHAGWYQGMEKREEVRMELQADIYCKKRLYGWFVNPKEGGNTDPLLLDWYFDHPEKIDFSKLWMSYDKLPAFAQLWQSASEGGEDDEETSPVKLYYYHLLGKGGKVMWQTVTRYNSPALAEKAEQYFYVFLLEMARSEASYYYEQMPGCENAYTLYLKDMDGKIIAVAPEVICGEDIEIDRATRIFNAMMFPVVESGKGYAFEINNIEQLMVGNKISYDYTTIWESAHVYDTPEEAEEALTTATGLLLDLRNYQRGDEDACGPFGITLVNPAGIQAEHPLSYTSISARNAAMEYVQTVISAEGLHLLEHILMRPRGQQQSYEALQLQLNWHPERKSTFVLRIVSESVFADASAYIKALQAATDDNKVFVEKQVSMMAISWYRKDEKIAVASLPATEEVIELLSDLAFVRKEMKSLTDGASEANVSTVVIPIVCKTEDAILPVCNEVCLCCDDEEDIDEENAAFCDRTFLADPYSFWATVVLPAWPQRFRLARFRQFFEDTLRREAPSHIRLNIVWISPQQMLQYEKAWKQWLGAMSREESCDYDDSLQALNKILRELKNVYPAAYLYDEEGGDDKPLIILDEAMLG
ncbi:hypothetical protein L3C95_18860 [Chitinophaga filiformis]|uniref:hypothetical protein n=1 Tax=Chitinophaga filiformis TaxID=104663 RepID=UPI001F20113C|nr:hypothetical protein [Chitinophaga filiformis]MCF6404969.1 hypothetical protein [Chitinophaga filiformis]